MYYRGYYYQIKGVFGKAVADCRRASELNAEIKVTEEFLGRASRRSDEIDLLNVNTDVDQKLVCRWLKATGTRLKNRKECRTEREWAKLLLMFVYED